MALSDYVHTFGQYLLKRHGERVHKIALDAGFTCPNRDGSKGIGGCTFCNNNSFSPNGHGNEARHARSLTPVPPLPKGEGYGSSLRELHVNAQKQRELEEQLDSGRRAITRRTRAKKYLAYFQAYTNTYADVAELDALYRQAMTQQDIVGLCVGTRPDCVSGKVLDLLADYLDEGRIVWLELGLQSAFDETLRRVNRGHGLQEYRTVAVEARRRGIPLCTHLILGLPGEDESHYRASLDTVLDIGVDGLKLHALHVVKQTVLANQWRRGEYQPLEREAYIRHACDLIERTPQHIVFHRVTGTASQDILLAPEWCSQKWNILNGIEFELKRRGHRQGCLAGIPWVNGHDRDVASDNEACHARFPHPNPDETTSQSTKSSENDDQVAGYLPQAGRAQRGGRSRANESLCELHTNEEMRDAV